MKAQFFRLITAVALSAGMFSCSSGKYYMFSSKSAETRPVAQQTAPVTEEETAVADLAVSASADATPAPVASPAAQAFAKARPAAKTAAVSAVAAAAVEKAAAEKTISPKKLAKLEKKINKAAEAAADGKSQLVALILVVLVGGLGIHRFYLGYTWQGVVQLLTLGGCGIWALIDLVRIAMGDLKPKDGEYEKTL